MDGKHTRRMARLQRHIDAATHDLVTNNQRMAQYLAAINDQKV